MKKKNILLVICLMVVVSVASIAGTIAWLTDSTETVTNTFSPTDIDVTLTETFNTDKNNDGTNDAWEADLIPGKEYSKNPKVAVETTTDVDVWLFVKAEESTAKDYLNYTLTLTSANGWTQGDGTDIPANVWYREVKTTATTKEWYLLDGNKVVVNNALTKAGMPTESVTLSFTAYAIQKEGFEDDVAEAWAKLNPTSGT